MFREMRREEKGLGHEECHEILRKAEYGTLATMGADGYPYAVSVNFVFHEGCIYFHCATVGHKLDNIEHCPKVSLNVVTDVFVLPLVGRDGGRNNRQFNGFDTNFNSVVVFGKAGEVFGDEKLNGLVSLSDKFLGMTGHGDLRDEGRRYIERSLARTKLIKIEVEHMTGKRGIRTNVRLDGKQH